MVTSGFMRRIASIQAVSRKVEGIGPRKGQEGKGDTVLLVEANMNIDANGKKMFTSSGSETMACMTL
jgi:hypothetical protein